VRGGSAHLSRGNFEQCGDELRLGLDVVAADVLNLPFPDYCLSPRSLPAFVARPKASKAKPRADQPFHVPVVLLDDVVQVFYLSHP
jgi:hypothetical protein